MYTSRESAYGVIRSSEYKDADQCEITPAAIFAGLHENTTAHGIPNIHNANGLLKTNSVEFLAYPTLDFSHFVRIFIQLFMTIDFNSSN